VGPFDQPCSRIGMRRRCSSSSRPR
jgi:hypothetical protein